MVNAHIFWEYCCSNTFSGDRVSLHIWHLRRTLQPGSAIVHLQAKVFIFANGALSLQSHAEYNRAKKGQKGIEAPYPGYTYIFRDP